MVFLKAVLFDALCRSITIVQEQFEERSQADRASVGHADQTSLMSWSQVPQRILCGVAESDGSELKHFIRLIG